APSPCDSRADRVRAADPRGPTAFPDRDAAPAHKPAPARHTYARADWCGLWRPATRCNRRWPPAAPAPVSTARAAGDAPERILQSGIFSRFFYVAPLRRISEKAVGKNPSLRRGYRQAVRDSVKCDLTHRHIG